MSHERLSPSGSAGWTLCPGQINQIQRCGIKDTSGPAAKLGTAAHELLEKCLIKRKPPITYKGKTFNKEEGGFIADDEMIDGVIIAYDFVMERVSITGGTLIPERKVNPGILIARNDCKGTADVTIVTENSIESYDYKNGFTDVEVKNNTQLLLYVIGVLAEMSPLDRQKIQYVTIGVLQPNGVNPDGPCRIMVYKITDIYAWASWFAERAAATDDPNAPLVPGDKQCKWCQAKPTCPALGKQVTTGLAAEAFKDVPGKIYRDPAELSMEETRLILDHADQITAFIKAVVGHAQAQLVEGIDVPGHKLVRGKSGHRKWTITDDKVIKKLSSSFGLKKPEVTGAAPLLGIAKILKLTKDAPKYSDDKLKNLEALIEKPPGKLVIAPESDERKAAFITAETAFKDVPKIEKTEKK